MPFACGGASPTAGDSYKHPLSEPAELTRQSHSIFGDNYSVGQPVSANNSFQASNNDPEVDYDAGPTVLYECIENKDWDGALQRLEKAPVEARTWVSRRDAATGKTRWRLLPLHAVCIFRAPLQLMEALIAAYPDGPQQTDDQGMLPVHLACRNGASQGVVLTLLQAFPASLQSRDRKQRIPADLVQASQSANKEVVLEAIARFERGYEQGVRSAAVPAPPGTAASIAQQSTLSNDSTLPEVDYEHRTVLFRLILKKDWSAAAARAKAHPQEAATFIVTKGFHGNLRFLPLHKACVLSPPLSVVDALLKAFPGAVTATDQDGWLPLHCACFYGAPDKVVKALLQANEKGAQHKDDEGRLPLHYACLKGASQGVVDALLAAYSKGCHCKDDEGRLPIHHACSKSAPEGIIDALLKASPKGSQSKDDQGRLPLHHACRKNASERVLRTLLRVYPRAAQIKDDQDKLPIHYACHNVGASPVVVTLLLQTYPESIHVKNGFGYTPLAEAQALDNPKMAPVIKVLEKFAKQQNESGGSSENPELEQRIATLEDQVDVLEGKLAKVAGLGRDMQKDLKRKKDPADILAKLAEKLVDLGTETSREKTPLKNRQSLTPGRNIFGRSKSASKGKA